MQAPLWLEHQGNGNVLCGDELLVPSGKDRFCLRAIGQPGCMRDTPALATAR
jgi:hypothetical protein